MIHGFRLISEDEISELSGRLLIYNHEKSGAELAFIDRDDENKTFAISFKTLPEDDTGVFHILEHSVLCGSDKFPVKEPFVELLKASLKTFLNAFTFPDKTMYPVSSRNDKDFLNLTDVYMDAVFHPLAKKNPEIFYQEGWHHEIHSFDEPLTYKGVVFNEMKGAYSSVDELEMSEAAKLLYRGTVYGFDSGGSPEMIPTLTYEQFCAAHDKYYHPSNAKIILDGSVDLPTVLALLDGYLCEYSATEIELPIPEITPKGSVEHRIEYEIGENEDSSGKARICFGYLASRYNERCERLALTAITDALAATNESPFKKAVLDTGLVEDLSFFQYDGIRHNSLMLELKHFKEEDSESLITVVKDTLIKLTEDGFDKNLLSASLSRMEFRAREQDGLGFPAGIANAISLLDGWLYGGSPAEALRFEETFAFLRKALASDYYENLFRQTVLKSEHSVMLTLIPSKTLGAQRLADEQLHLAEQKSAMTDEQIKAKIHQTEALELWQKAPDSKQNLDTLPTLCLEDIEPLPRKREYEVISACETDAVFIPVDSKGITYIDILFDISDFCEEQIFKASLLCDILKNVRTDKHSAVDLQTEIKHHLGAFYFSVVAFECDGVTTPYIKAHISCLDSKKAEALSLLKEVVYGSELLTEQKVVSNIIKQTRSMAREGIISSGHSVAMGRIAANFSEEALVSEYTEGLEFYLLLKELADNLDFKIDNFIKEIDFLRRKAFTLNRAKIFYSGAKDCKLTANLCSALEKCDDSPVRHVLTPLGKRREGIAVPSQISYACLGSNLVNAIGCNTAPGYFSVARSILSLGYLWNEVRIQGGAYGAGLTHRINGSVAFYSYRDPTPERSLGIYISSADYLKEISQAGDDITGFIIGTLGDSDPLMTPKLTSALTIRDYMRNESYDDRAKRRAQILKTSHSDLLKSAEIIKALVDDCGVCIVGGMEMLQKCKARIDAIIEI